MSLRFVGGERLQRGRGIGGLLRLAKSVFSPLLKKAGSAVVSAAKSKAGQSAIKSLKKQAIDSSLNVATDILSGKNVGDSLKDEVSNVKEASLAKLSELHDNIGRKRQSEYNPKKKPKYKRRKVRDILD